MKVNKGKAIRSQFVTRKRTTNDVDGVNPVAASRPAKNELQNDSGNFLDEYDRYYDKMKELSEELKEFTKSEYNFEQLVKTDDADELIQHIDEIIFSYNHALITLHKLDQTLHQEHFSLLSRGLDRRRVLLQAIGITYDSRLLLSLDKEVFRQEILTRESAKDQLANAFHFIADVFHRISFAQKKQEPGRSTFDLKGLVINNKI